MAIQLTDDQARELAEHAIMAMRKIGAVSAIEAIEQSRQEGVEESLTEDSLKGVPRQHRKAMLKEVGSRRRRPPNGHELLAIVLDQLEQRLVAVPRFAAEIASILHTDSVTWNADPEFFAPETRERLNADMVQLQPAGSDESQVQLRRIREQIPALRRNSEGEG